MIKSFVERFNIFFNDVSLMFSEKRVIKQPYRLFLDYLRFRYKMRFGKNVQCEKIFGFEMRNELVPKKCYSVCYLNAYGC